MIQGLHTAAVSRQGPRGCGTVIEGEHGEGKSLEGKGQVLTVRAWHQEPEGGHTRTVGCVHGSRWHFEPVPWKYLMCDGFI